MLFSEAAELYMSDKSKRLRGTTLEGYESALRCHLLPMWGARHVEEITFEELQAWVDGFAKPGAAEKAYKTFRQVYRWVLRRRQLRIWDVTQGIELPKKPPVRRPTLTADEERETLRGIVGQPFEAAVLLGAALGLRRCEACAVRIEDIDWRSGWVHVHRGLHVVKGKEIETAARRSFQTAASSSPASLWNGFARFAEAAGLAGFAPSTRTPSRAASAPSAAATNCRTCP